MMSYDCPHPVSRTYQYKKITKPLLERKRRARINRCLEELKDLMMQALETEGENISKLEKADILELTVRHLQRLQASRPSGLSTSSVTNDDVSSESRWQSGFGHCAAEACRFLSALPGEAAERLAKHLASGLNVPNLKTAMKISSDVTTNVISNLDRTAKMVSPTSNATPPDNNAVEARLLSKSFSVSRLNVCTSPQTELKTNVLRPDQKRFLECSVTTTQFSHVSKHANGATGADEEEEIDVERIDERENSDPMWRPW